MPSSHFSSSSSTTSSASSATNSQQCNLKQQHHQHHSTSSSTKSKLKQLITHQYTKTLRPISLDTCLLTILVFLLQIYLIINRFRLLRELGDNANSSFFYLIHSSSSKQQDALATKLNATLIVNVFLVSFALIFAIFYLLINAFKLDIYSHDNFKLGNDFDSKLQAKIRKDDLSSTTITISPSSSSSTTNGVHTSTSSSTQALQIKKKSPNNIKTFLLSWTKFKKPSYWSQLPPLGALLHLLSAILLLIAELQISSKRIQLGHKPIGDIFSTKLDFLFGQPINRLDMTHKFEQQHDKPDSENLIIQSKDDFSMFVKEDVSLKQQQNQITTSSSVLFIMTSNTISLDYLNLLIALIVLSVKMSQLFWHTNKLFTLVLMMYHLMASSLILLSYCSYEVLFKCVSLQKLAKKLLILNSRSQMNVDHNFDEFYAHDLIATFLFMLSLCCLIINGCLNVRSGFKKFYRMKVRFETNILKYLNTNKMKSQNESISSSITTAKANCLKKNGENLFSLGLFLVYCAFRSLFLFELIVVFKYSNDILFLINIFAEMLMILVWILTFALVNLKNDWSFGISPNYKLIHWNWLYLNQKSVHNNSRQSLQSKLHQPLISTTNSVITELSSNKNDLSNDLIKIKCITATNCPSKNRFTADNKTEIPIEKPNLLVRDDSSLAMNRSSNLSSSSITEVSSLQPSVCTQIMNPNLMAAKQHVSILNPSTLSATSKTHLKAMLKLSRNLDNDLNSQDSSLNRLSSEVMFTEEYDDSLNDFGTVSKHQRSASCRQANANTQQQFILNQYALATKHSTASKPVIATIGEIMEPKKQNFILANKKCANEYVQQMSSCSTSSSSSSGNVDSGRDSIIDSPNNNNTNNSNTTISQKTALSKSSFLILGSQSTKTSGIYNDQSANTSSSTISSEPNNHKQKLANSKSNGNVKNLLDTRC